MCSSLLSLCWAWVPPCLLSHAGLGGQTSAEEGRNNFWISWEGQSAIEAIALLNCFGGSFIDPLSIGNFNFGGFLISAVLSKQLQIVEENPSLSSCHNYGHWSHSPPAPAVTVSKGLIPLFHFLGATKNRVRLCRKTS